MSIFKLDERSSLKLKVICFLREAPPSKLVKKVTSLIFDSDLREASALTVLMMIGISTFIDS